MDEVTKVNRSGSTFTGVIVTEDGNLVTAHLGDSPASAIIIGKDGGLKHIKGLIAEHTPGKEEEERHSLSGRVFYDQGERRYVSTIDQDGVEKEFSIAMTHALGDAAFGDVLSHTPEIVVHDIQKLLQEGDRLFLLVTSDGAHNEGRSITHKTHAPTIASGLTRNWSLAEISDQIAANSKLIRDNVTVTLLEVERGKGAIIAIFDGHGGSETSDQAQRILLNLTERFAQQDKLTTIEELASAVALEERLQSLEKRLADAYELRGDFSKGAELVEWEQKVKKKLAGVAKIRELQTQRVSETGEEVGRLQQEIQKIYDEHRMGSYGEPGYSFEQNVDLFESDWKADLSTAEAKIEDYNDRALWPEMRKMQLEIAEIKTKISIG